jgi:hypothetical protein
MSRLSPVLEVQANEEPVPDTDCKAGLRGLRLIVLFFGA